MFTQASTRTILPRPRWGSKTAWLLVATMFAFAGLLRWAEGRYLFATNLTGSLTGKFFLIDLRADPATLNPNKVIAFHHNGTRWNYPDKAIWAKRLVGLPGDSIELNGDLLLIGGRPSGRLNPAAMARTNLSPVHARKVPPGHYFVLGDHVASLDSRYAEFGFVAQQAVIGTAQRLW